MESTDLEIEIEIGGMRLSGHAPIVVARLAFQQVCDMGPDHAWLTDHRGETVEEFTRAVLSFRK